MMNNQISDVQPYQVIRAKDIENLMNVSNITAKRYISDIKAHFKIKLVLFRHYKEYFKIPN